MRHDTIEGLPHGAGPGGTAAEDDRGHGPEHRRPSADPLFQVRTSDVEPYTGLGYLSKLFRFVAVILLILLGAEIVTGLTTEGRDSIATLLSEGSRLLVLAALLWGVGDLATLLIDVGHDVRAARVLLGRQATHLHALLELERPAPAAAPPEAVRAPALEREVGRHAGHLVADRPGHERVGRGDGTRAGHPDVRGDAQGGPPGDGAGVLHRAGDGTR
jgi:hypothetical protein